MSSLETGSAVHASDGLRFDEARIERAELTSRHLKRALAPGSRVVETFRVLRSKVEALDAERPLRRIGVVAATPGEGATTTALCLAASLVRNGARRVLLLEAVLRAPALETLMGLDPAPGLSDWLADGGVGPVPLCRVEPWGFQLLAAGTARPEPAPLLESGHLGRLLDAASRHFEFVVVDCPPLVPVADSVLIQDRLDGYLLVVRARRTARERVLQAISELKPERLRGVVLNDLREIFARAAPLGSDRRS